MPTVNNSYVYRNGTTPNTRTVVSSKNKVYGYTAGQNAFTQIAVMNTFDPTHGRAADPVRGVGYGDQIAELVPGVSDPVTISVSRTALYLHNIFQAFGYKGGVDGLVRSLKHHRWPFDIKQELVFSELSSNDSDAANNTKEAKIGSLRALITYYEACWMTSYSTSFAADTAIVVDNCDISVSDITDGSSPYNSEFIDSGLNPFSDPKSSLRFAVAGGVPTI